MDIDVENAQLGEVDQLAEIEHNLGIIRAALIAATERADRAEATVAKLTKYRLEEKTKIVRQKCQIVELEAAMRRQASKRDGQQRRVIAVEVELAALRASIPKLLAAERERCADVAFGCGYTIARDAIRALGDAQ